MVRAVNGVERRPGRWRARRPRDHHRRQHRQRARPTSSTGTWPCSRAARCTPIRATDRATKGWPTTSSSTSGSGTPRAEQADLPRPRTASRTVPGLLDAVPGAVHRRRVSRSPWLAVHGNHDQLVQGTIAGDRARRPRSSVGYRKPIACRALVDRRGRSRCSTGLATVDAGRLIDAGCARPDAGRSPPIRPGARSPAAEFVAAHFGPPRRPAGHGFAAANRESAAPTTATTTAGSPSWCIDTVDEYGGWQGSLDLDQFGWLQAELSAADAERRYVVLASHHPLDTLVNDTSGGARPPGARRRVRRRAGPAPERRAVAGRAHPPHRRRRRTGLVGGDGAVADRLAAAGPHRRTRSVTAVGWWRRGDDARPRRRPRRGRSDRHVDAMAGLSRELAANDWQWRREPLEAHPRSGACRGPQCAALPGRSATPDPVYGQPHNPPVGVHRSRNSRPCSPARSR